MSPTPQIRTIKQEDPPTAERQHGGNGRNGGDRRLDDRLRNVEIQVAEISIKLETQLGHLATKNEVTKLKVWVLSGVLGGMAIAATIALAVARLFS